MARSSGTRRGNGSGWGGKAKGESTATGEKRPPFEPGNQEARGYHDMTRQERLAALDERKWMIAMGKVDNALPVHVSAINSYEDRHQGKARQSVELSGADGSPLMPPALSVVLVPPKVDDAS